MIEKVCGACFVAIPEANASACTKCGSHELYEIVCPCFCVNPSTAKTITFVKATPAPDKSISYLGDYQDVVCSACGKIFAGNLLCRTREPVNLPLYTQGGVRAEMNGWTVYRKEERLDRRVKAVLLSAIFHGMKIK